jgi:tetratricopeptide (TPR) repeat protein
MSKKNWHSYFKALKTQDFETAKSLLQQISQEEKNNPLVHMKLGNIYQRTGDIFNAIESYYNSASLLKSEGVFQKALAVYKIILQLDPSSSKAINNATQIMKELESSKSPHIKPHASAISSKAPSVSPELPKSLPSVSPEEPLTAEEWLEATSKIPEDLPEEMKDFAVSLSEREEFFIIPKILSRMPDQSAKKFLNSLDTISFSDNETVIEEGDRGDSIYIIKSGKARVVTLLLSKEIELALLDEGDIFGEVAFLTGRPRTATVISQGPLVVSEIKRLELENLIESDPELLSILEDFYEIRLHDTIKQIKK